MLKMNCCSVSDKMPTYEMAILLKTLPRPELAAALKRTANAIFDQGGVIRKIDNLGHRPTPFKISAHDARHKEANYFIFSFEANETAKTPLFDNYQLDVDVVRCRIFHCKNLSLKPIKEQPCTLHEDLLPPPYRPSVQKMVELGERRVKPPFKQNSGLDYYPFQR